LIRADGIVPHIPQLGQTPHWILYIPAASHRKGARNTPTYAKDRVMAGAANAGIPLPAPKSAEMGMQPMSVCPTRDNITGDAVKLAPSLYFDETAHEGAHAVVDFRGWMVRRDWSNSEIVEKVSISIYFKPSA
jgi:hypothetical protein